MPMTDQSIMQLMEVLVIILCVYHEWKQNVRFFERLKISGFALKQNANLKCDKAFSSLPLTEQE